MADDQKSSKAPQGAHVASGKSSLFRLPGTSASLGVAHCSSSGSSPGSLPIGAFCCLECSGSHRRLGVHISFVRSINLDSWKEKEVLAMENGGNLKVNAIFEANLARSGVQKPSNHADGPTRERFIRDKYERRKFYDPASFANLPAPSSSAPTVQPAQGTEVGPPSDAARQRMEQRRLRKIQSAPATEEARQPPKPTRSSSTDRPRSRTPPRLNATKPGPRRTTRRQSSEESLEKEMDLLDLNFVAAPAAETKPESSSHDLFNFLVVQDPAQPKQQPPKSSTLDIMSLYGNNNNNEYQRQNSLSSFGNLTVSNIMEDPNNSSGYTAQQMQQMNMRPMPNMQQQMMMMQQQQQMMMMQQQQRMMMGNNNMMMMPNNATNGFGAPMGSGPPSFQGQTVNKAPEKEDPFAQFGVNHFR